ncbi:hypothetical protein [Escherichia coli]|uniref:hypothetical protein n=1 Tax=Escherichia coli TaxID=562 RepID=UPI00390892C1
MSVGNIRGYVGIQILDRTGEVLILDGATFSAKTDLIDGTNILPFQARYIALGQSVAGTANADMRNGLYLERYEKSHNI